MSLAKPAEDRVDRRLASSEVRPHVRRHVHAAHRRVPMPGELADAKDPRADSRPTPTGIATLKSGFGRKGGISVTSPVHAMSGGLTLRARMVEMCIRMSSDRCS